MQTTTLTLSTLLCCAVTAQTPRWREPVRLVADGAPIQVEAPGYAAPCWHDVDGDGHGDLVTGQFHDGKIKVYRGRGDGTFAAGSWLEAEGDTAVVPGVW